MPRRAAADTETPVRSRSRGRPATPKTASTPKPAKSPRARSKTPKRAV